MCLPVVQSYSEKHPDAEIHFLTKERYAAILKDETAVKKIHTLADSKATTLFQLIKQLRRERYSKVIDLHSSSRSRIVGFILGFGRLGLRRKRLRKPYLRRLFLVLFKRRKSLQNYSVMENYATTAGVKLNRAWSYPLAEQDKQTVAEKLKADWQAPAYFCLMAASTWFTKAYPSEYFETLISALLNEYPQAKAILLGGRDDIEVNEKIIADLRNRNDGIDSKTRIINAAGALSIGETAALLNKTEFLVTGDTGVMHIGSGLGIRVYAIFGGTSRELGFFPVTDNVMFIENNQINCRPCSPKGKPACPKNHFDCMLSLKPEQILQTIKQSTTI